MHPAFTSAQTGILRTLHSSSCLGNKKEEASSAKCASDHGAPRNLPASGARPGGSETAQAQGHSKTATGSSERHLQRGQLPVQPRPDFFVQPLAHREPDRGKVHALARAEVPELSFPSQAPDFSLQRLQVVLNLRSHILLLLLPTRVHEHLVLLSLLASAICKSLESLDLFEQVPLCLVHALVQRADALVQVRRVGVERIQVRTQSVQLLLRGLLQLRDATQQRLLPVVDVQHVQGLRGARELQDPQEQVADGHLAAAVRVQRGVEHAHLLRPEAQCLHGIPLAEQVLVQLVLADAAVAVGV
mmetsp:Transcript_103562/g.302245  ORF Transcript_103562/g.302245 Transcript_103562/m.302245 type:complete len:302 (+) Transcript_103562:2-907(+)